MPLSYPLWIITGAVIYLLLTGLLKGPEWTAFKSFKRRGFKAGPRALHPDLFANQAID